MRRFDSHYPTNAELEQTRKSQLTTEIKKAFLRNLRKIKKEKTNAELGKRLRNRFAKANHKVEYQGAFLRNFRKIKKEKTNAELGKRLRNRFAKAIHKVEFHPAFLRDL